MPPAHTRLGVLGGTFDPPHIGHVAAAMTVREALSLDRVLLVVANEPWQKVGSRSVTPAGDRLAMVEAAVAEFDDIEANGMEIVRGGASFTIDTLEHLRRVEPEADLFLIVGADTAAGLGTWERHGELPALATLVIVDREGAPEAPTPPGWTTTHVSMPPVDVSSTGVRERAAAGESIVDLVPATVVDLIRDRRLYGLSAS